MTRLRDRAEADAPDQLSRGDRGARQSRRWLASEIPLGALLETPYGEVIDEAPREGLRVRTHDVDPPEAGLPTMPWTVNRKEQVWTPRLAHLVEQANASQWNASLDIPWSGALGLADHLEEAVCDLFTWLLQQELTAHQVPAAWLPQIHPAFLEVRLFLSGKVMDEARHTEACIKRLWLNGVGPTATSPDTDRALALLCLLEDYEQASLLVDVLGEGQILDVFKIVYDLAPDEATRRIVLLSRRDEARHVSYGVARLKHRIETASDPEAVGRQIVDWIAARIEVSDEFFALPELVHEALGVLGREVGVDGKQRAREFPAEANAFRRSRLEAAGLPPRALGQVRSLLERN
ncbi:MAG TPA: ferritin-like domain-containing protein [Solirubrobacteraceae bacterium]